MYNKTIIRFGFCGIQNNQGLGKGYQPQPSASAHNPHLDLDYSLKSEISDTSLAFLDIKVSITCQEFHSLFSVS